MRLDSKLFRSRLAWRFFSLFVICALVPILSLALLIYTLTADHLKEGAFEGLRSHAKTHAMSLFDLLLIADQQLKFLGDAHLSGASQDAQLIPLLLSNQRTAAIFQSLVIKDQGPWRPLTGKASTLTALDEALNALPEPGETVLAVVSQEGDMPSMVLVHRPFDAIEVPVYLAGLLNRDYLWESDRGSILPADIHWGVWDSRGHVLYSTLSQDKLTEMQTDSVFDGAHSGTAILSSGGSEYYTAFWSLFTKPQFNFPHLSVLVMQPKKSVLAPFHTFQFFFPMVMLLSLAIVVYVSSVAIRRSLNPIDSLMEGARQVARGCFTHQVVTDSKDEFQQLAESFNHMSRRLDNHFKLLSARSELDRDILSLLEIESIIHKIPPKLSLFFPCKVGAIAIIEGKRTGSMHVFNVSQNGSGSALRSEVFHHGQVDQAFFNAHEDWLVIREASDLPAFLQELHEPEIASWVLMPVRYKYRPFALICLGVANDIVYTRDDLEQAKLLAEQVAVAFSNARLVSELKELNLGASNALARTVDAKSPWTAGHSERVTQMCIDLGKIMGYSDEELQDFRHAALLHDIGKIGIPASILDKKGALNPEETEFMRQHPSIGARILQPIHAYRQLIPIMEQHHERYDGSGYPKGLAGEEIHPLARIMAVADSFDAMVSDRPYRKGMTFEKALSIINQDSGSMFDPDVVNAFAEMMNGNLTLSSPRQDDVSPGKYEEKTITGLPATV